jgi:hypothetical protein
VLNQVPFLFGASTAGQREFYIIFSFASDFAHQTLLSLKISKKDQK